MVAYRYSKDSANGFLIAIVYFDVESIESILLVIDDEMYRWFLIFTLLYFFVLHSLI